MRKLIVLSFLGLFFVGCANIKYQTPTGEKFSYNRLGLQKLDGFTLTKNEQGVVSVSFTKQEGGESIAEVLNKVSDVAVAALKKVP